MSDDVDDDLFQAEWILSWSSSSAERTLDETANKKKEGQSEGKKRKREYQEPFPGEEDSPRIITVTAMSIPKIVDGRKQDSDH